jgi:hypothetical protein
MVKKSIVFYVFLFLLLVATLLIPFNYGLLTWILVSWIGNSLIIQKAITQNPEQKKTLIIISSAFILLPILYVLGIVLFMGGIEC